MSRLSIKPKALGGHAVLQWVIGPMILVLVGIVWASCVDHRRHATYDVETVQP